MCKNIFTILFGNYKNLCIFVPIIQVTDMLYGCKCTTPIGKTKYSDGFNGVKPKFSANMVVSSNIGGDVESNKVWESLRRAMCKKSREGVTDPRNPFRK
jgi:hypothetical protein